MNLQDAQESLQLMFKNGVFHYPPDMATITLQERNELLHAMDPTPYTLAFECNGVNYLEKVSIDMNGSIVETIRSELTWEVKGMRVFELTVTTLPSVIIVERKPPEKVKVLVTTWIVEGDGKVVAYRVTFNDEVLDSIGF